VRNVSWETGVSRRNGITVVSFRAMQKEPLHGAKVQLAIALARGVSFTAWARADDRPRRTKVEGGERCMGGGTPAAQQGGPHVPDRVGAEFSSTGGDGATGVEASRVRQRLDNISQVARTKPK